MMRTIHAINASLQTADRQGCIGEMKNRREQVGMRDESEDVRKSD